MCGTRRKTEIAITDAYADNGDYKAIFSGLSGDHDTELDEQLLFVSRWVDRDLGYKETGFNRDDAVIARIYYPPGFYSGDPEAENPWLGSRATRDLAVDPISTATGLVIRIDEDQDGVFTDETVLAATDYELRPLNADKGPEPRPWDTIRLTRWGTRSAWPNGSAVQVTARFGFPAVPPAIRQLTIQLLGIWRADSALATDQISQGFDSVIGASDIAQGLLEKVRRSYKKRWVVV